MNRRESIGRVNALTQSASGPPTMEMVSVAVLPPRLPPGMAPPTGVGMADAFGWDEALNWQHNDPEPKDGDKERKKSIFKRAGLTTKRTHRGADSGLPPFVLRQIPYDTWRKHYAKDKDGNYRGTHTPAEDCLLKPEDVQKWNLGEVTGQADRWTRGSHALPVYSEVQEEGMVPEYEVGYDGPPRDGGPRPEAPIAERDGWDNEIPPETPASATPKVNSRPNEQANRQQSVPYRGGTQTIDGKTAEEIIAEAKAKPPPKGGWKKMLQKGAEWGSMG